MAMVTIYTTPTCVYCKMAKAFLGKNHIAYEEKNVATDADARDRMIQKSGQLGVPVLEVGDAIIVGFDKLRIAQLTGVTK